MLERWEKKIGDEPVLRNAIPRIGMSRPGEEEWLLPRGVRGVLLPSPTHRRGIHIDTEMGDNYVRRAANDEVVHQPQQVLRLIVDRTVTEDELARIRGFLELGSLVTIHWHRGDPDVVLSYTVEGEIVGEAAAVVMERSVRFVERENQNDAAE